MKIQHKTLKNGFTMPTIGMGTWMTNTGHKPHASLHDEKRIQEIKDAIASGISYIDTAQRYANGYVETLIGKAIKGNNSREKLFIASKVSSDQLSFDDVILAAKASVRRLQASYLDLYFIHQYNPDIPIKETMRAMDYLLEKKLIKNIGVCNFTVKQLEEAQSYTKNKIVANQLRYNLMHKTPEQLEIVNYCQKHDIMVIAWRPFQPEFLTPKIETVLNEMAKKYAKTPSQIATSWLVTQPNIVVLSKLHTANQIEKILDAAELTIDPKDMVKFTIESN